MGNSHGRIGEVSEVRRSGGELCLDWRIPRFLDLGCGYFDCYVSPRFGFHDALWHLEVCPNWLSSGQVFLSIHRDDDDAGPSSTRTVTFSLGLRGSGGGVEWRREEEEHEFKKSGGYNSVLICESPELREQEDRLMEGGTITFVCQMKVPGTDATGASSCPDVPIRTNTQTRETNARKCQSLDKKDASTQTEFELKEARVDDKQSSRKRDALDDDAKEKLNGNNDRENDDESEKKKNLNLSRVKNTKKISLPARHGDVIRSLKAILAEGRRADFSLKSDGGEWRVHRAILEGRSGHFETLFRGEWAQRDEVRLDDVPEGGALDGVLHFAYAGEVGDMSAESVGGIYGAAHRFLLEDLKSLCVEYMEERMCPERVCGALAVAETYGEGDLKERAMECFFRESGTVCETEGWKELKANHPAIIAELFKEFIKRERKNRKRERD